MNPSTIPAVKSAFEDRIGNLMAGSDDVVVSQGHPDPVPAERVLVVIGDTSDRTLGFVAAMTQANETYEIEIIISVTGIVGDATQAVLLAQAWGIADTVIADVLTWRTEGFPPGVGVIMPIGGDDAEANDGTNREATVTQRFAVTARL